jgi:hypothetical protein
VALKDALINSFLSTTLVIIGLAVRVVTNVTSIMSVDILLCPEYNLSAMSGKIIGKLKKIGRYSTYSFF